jgi:hypothetical protein
MRGGPPHYLKTSYRSPSLTRLLTPTSKHPSIGCDDSLSSYNKLNVHSILLVTWNTWPKRPRHGVTES